MYKRALIFVFLLHSSFCFPESIQSKEEAVSVFAKRTVNDAIALTKITTGGIVLLITGMSISMIRKQRSEWAPRGGAVILFSMAMAGGFNVWSGAKDFKNM